MAITNPTTAVIAERLLRRPPEREVIIHDPAHSVRWIQHDFPAPIARWNYHPEYEIHLIRKSTGRFIVGDHIGAFAPGQVTLVGSGVPHHWLTDLEPGQVVADRDALVHFNGEWLMRAAAELPELLEVKALLQDSARGLLFSGETAVAAAEQIELMGVTQGLARLSHFFQLLAVFTLASSSERQPLAREWFVPPQASSVEYRAVEMGLGYLFANLNGTVRMAEAAKLAGMTEARFSRFFQRASGRTFSETLRKLRITRARIMLEQTTDPIASICYDVGFTNVSNFNRQFLREVGMTPSAYRQHVEDEGLPGETGRLSVGDDAHFLKAPKSTHEGVGGIANLVESSLV